MDEGDLTPEIRAIQLPGKVIISATMSFSLSAHFPICPLTLLRFLSAPRHVLLSRTHYHQSMAEELTQQLRLRSSISPHCRRPPRSLAFVGTRAKALARTLLSCVAVRLGLIERVSDIRLTCFLCSGRGRGFAPEAEKKESLFDGIAAVG